MRNSRYQGYSSPSEGGHIHQTLLLHGDLLKNAIKARDNEGRLGKYIGNDFLLQFLMNFKTITDLSIMFNEKSVYV